MREGVGKDRKGHVIPTKVVEGLGVYIQISLSLSLCIYTPLLFRYMSQLRAEDGPSKSSQQPRLASHSQLAFGPVWKSRTCATLVTSLPNSFCPFRKSKQKKKTFLFFSRTKWQYVLFPLFFISRSTGYYTFSHRNGWSSKVAGKNCVCVCVSVCVCAFFSLRDLLRVICGCIPWNALSAVLIWTRQLQLCVCVRPNGRFSRQ